jgi:hypothetical protein
LATTVNVTHAPALTLSVATATVKPVTVTIAVTSVGERLWAGTNPLVSIYPWYGQAISAAGQSASFGVPQGKTLYTYTSQPAQYTVTIA